jgi:pseudaminic acid biosynthesis-associated methylase
MTKAEQTAFWEGKFGDEYTERRRNLVEERIGFFKKILTYAEDVESVIELGANYGQNLKAINKINDKISLTGVEVNQKACEQMSESPDIHSICTAIQQFDSSEQFDMVLVCGVLIHLPPEDLSQVYKKMFKLSKKYILLNEYFNPVPVEIPYHGHSKKLFKRDFGAEFVETLQGKVKLVDYGFLWKKVEPAWDNTNWWLFARS